MRLFNTVILMIIPLSVYSAEAYKFKVERTPNYYFVVKIEDGTAFDIFVAKDMNNKLVRIPQSHNNKTTKYDIVCDVEVHGATGLANYKGVIQMENGVPKIGSPVGIKVAIENIRE
jgi:hypothetical protein